MKEREMEKIEISKQLIHEIWSYLFQVEFDLDTRGDRKVYPHLNKNEKPIDLDYHLTTSRNLMERLDDSRTENHSS